MTRRPWADTARDLLSVPALIAALVGALGAAGITVQTTGSQLRQLVRADSLERLERDADRQVLRTLVRVVCAQVVRDDTERMKYGLMCKQLERMAGAPALPGGPVLVLRPGLPRSHRPPPLPPPARPGHPTPMLPAGRADAPRFASAP